MTYLYAGTVFLKHPNRKNWFVQFSIYWDEDRTAYVVAHEGRGKGCQKQAIKSLGIKVPQSIVDKNKAKELMIDEKNVGFEALKERIKASYPDAIWHWAE